MCEQCLVNPYYYGEVLPGFFLIRARRDGSFMKCKEWGIVECNDPSIVFEITPKKISEDEDGIVIKEHKHLLKLFDEWNDDFVTTP